MKNKQVIMVAPTINTKNLAHLLPGIENSDTIISVQPMYTKVPAAKLLKITSTITPALEARMPMTIPNGVAIAKIATNHLTSRKSLGNALTRLMPSADPAAPLCTKIASIIERAEARSV